MYNVFSQRKSFIIISELNDLETFAKRCLPSPHFNIWTPIYNNKSRLKYNNDLQEGFVFN